MCDHLDVAVGDSASELDQLLSDELDQVNAAAAVGISPQRELTVEIRSAGARVAGLSGWTWGTSAGIAMLWVREDRRGTGCGRLLLSRFEAEARERGCVQAFVTSFTFQAPAFYERHGYVEFARHNGLPAAPHADVHLVKSFFA